MAQDLHLTMAPPSSGERVINRYIATLIFIRNKILPFLKTFPNQEHRYINWNLTWPTTVFETFLL
jgi:hypothetical protein